MAKKLFEGMSFDALCKKYLKEGADIAALSEESAAPEMEGGVDEFDAEMDAPADEFGADEETATEGDVTITLSADLVAALRSILALVDGEGADEVEDVEVEDDLTSEDDVEPVEETEVEEPEMETEEEGVFEEDEEIVLGDEKGAKAAILAASETAPARKKGTPAVNRKGTGEGDFSKVTSREGEAAETLGAPARKKGTPSIDRAGHTAAHKATGKKILDVQR